MRVDPNYVLNLSSSLDLSSSQESQLTSELSSGLRVSSLSVDPTAVAQSALLDTAISQEDTYVQTASGETSRLQAADSALGEVVTQVTSAVSLAVSAGNGTLSSSDLSSVQQQLTAVRDSVLALANTSYGGTYLFSGSQGTTKPFAIDTSTVPATTTYSGDSVTQSVVTPTGQSIQVNLPGAAVFGSVLGALNQLIADFSGTGVSATVATDGAALTTALGQVSTQRSVLDSSLSTLESTSTYTQTQAANATNAQSTLMSADTATVATQLSAAETQHQALLSVISGLEQATDLFGYLH
ncbi:flagellar hook-associated protein FlgL [Granulicella arctica]|uniref:Flagellar hook-associated protein 3 FlgL n=1 Tax=Granulicella arctica TaxID=940613 RepID=A0A7Y9PHX6_9BACT|nr:flagellar hook-associated protein 3 FlgL [Granulicella arctica]